MKKKRISALALSTVLAVGLLAGCGAQKTVDPPVSEETQQGKSVENHYGSLKKFSAKTMDGGSFTQEDFKGVDVTAINFWSTTCNPCVDEMPELAKLIKALPENVKLITACMDGESDPDTAKKILSDAGFESPTLISGDRDWSSLIGKIAYTPTTIFVDADGNVVGEAVEGAPAKQVGEVYKEYIDIALKDIGKPEMKK